MFFSARPAVVLNFSFSIYIFDNDLSLKFTLNLHEGFGNEFENLKEIKNLNLQETQANNPKKDFFTEEIPYKIYETMSRKLA